MLLQLNLCTWSSIWFDVCFDTLIYTLIWWLKFSWTNFCNQLNQKFSCKYVNFEEKMDTFIWSPKTGHLKICYRWYKSNNSSLPILSVTFQEFNMLAPSYDNMLMSRVYKDLDINPDMRLTINEYINVDLNAEIAQDVIFQ